ncbi:prenyltransferase/squalene oxidase repeat-containing protein [Bacillus sp. NEB1478]|uniref:terpene cyclase/mutase family protein n=1 Tax=Bacillus sp. NEB1478 TaxID=3073816 RepID=UPI002872FBBC|nr:prenyltransferase/squalene oxidase repeat-containing protein [Bacillus sp. NEB1478]WNB93800.1 prenyltransferase/squalene oxidase repeat-containing protein [Bacillus sp. NEB1478]
MDWRALEKEIYRRCNELISLQNQDGTWSFCFENSVITDAFMLMMTQTLEMNNERLILQLTDRIFSQQSDDGLWRIYPDEKDGNLSSTIQAYVALLFSKKISVSDPRLISAKDFIIQKGGFKNCNLITRAFLAMNGLYDWPSLPINPAVLFSLPITAPINMYDISSYARAHFAPVFLMAYEKKSLTSINTPDLSHLLGSLCEDSQWEEWHNLYNLFSITEKFTRANEQNVLTYIHNHIESDGTLLSYGLTTILMIYGLIATGYDKSSSIIQNALNGLSKMFCNAEGTSHLQNSPSTVWDTSLILYTLQEAGVPINHKAITTGAYFLLTQQQYKLGDWSVHNPNAVPGGWGFSLGDTINPDIDDTQAALRSIKNFYNTHDSYQISYYKGVSWLLSMQNNDGGWAAFEKNTNRHLLGGLPIKNARDALIDPSTPDITGRTLEYLGNFHGFTLQEPSIKRAIHWLWDNQEKDGSWYGRWGICYIYGTWAAVTGLIGCGVNPNDRRIQRSLQWLLEHQNTDGGWGESCRSDVERKFVKMPGSTLSQSAWALNTLTSICKQPSEQMKKAVNYLISEQINTGYPTGAGLSDAFYIRYHSYDYIWPLLSLVHFYKKYYRN